MLHIDTQAHMFTVGNANSPTAYRQHKGGHRSCRNFLQWEESSGNRVWGKRKHFGICGMLTTIHPLAIGKGLRIVFLTPSVIAGIYVAQLY